jgi:hypothetical protein
MRYLIGMLAVTAFVAVACATNVPRWVGTDVHQVDGYWIGTESTCAAGDEICAAVVEDAGLSYQALHPEAVIVHSSMAEVPLEFHPAEGASFGARAFVGIETRTFSVLDLADGSRHVVPQMCHIAALGDGPTQVFGCGADPESPSPGMDWNDMDPWRVGREPTSPP